GWIVPIRLEDAPYGLGQLFGLLLTHEQPGSRDVPSRQGIADRGGGKQSHSPPRRLGQPAAGLLLLTCNSPQTSPSKTLNDFGYIPGQPDGGTTKNLSDCLTGVASKQAGDFFQDAKTTHPRDSLQQRL